MKLGHCLALCALGFLLSACATVTQGSTQSISLTSRPVQGAKCELQNAEGKWYVTTPGSAMVGRSTKDISVSCRLEGYHDAHQTIVSHFNGATVGNLIVGGLVGVTVDAVSGANNSYPRATEIVLSPSNGPDAGQPTDRPPTPLAGQPVNYPEDAQRNGWEGTVTLQVYVNEDGRVLQARMTRSSGFVALDNAAAESVLGWKFLPPLEHGSTVTAWGTVQVVYKVETPASH